MATTDGPRVSTGSTAGHGPSAGHGSTAGHGPSAGPGSTPGSGSTSGREVAHGLVRVVGLLVCVEIASGVLQGYYTPIYKDIAGHLDIRDASVNWFEAAQLIVSALALPLLARLGDLIGARNVLLISTAVTALGSWILTFAPGFTTFLIGF